MLLAVPAIAGSAVKGPSDCDYADVWHAHLTANYGEEYVKDTVVGQDSKAEVWVDPREGDWTMITVAGDQRCIYAYGEDWPQEWR